MSNGEASSSSSENESESGSSDDSDDEDGKNSGLHFKWVPLSKTVAGEPLRRLYVIVCFLCIDIGRCAALNIRGGRRAVRVVDGGRIAIVVKIHDFDKHVIFFLTPHPPPFLSFVPFCTSLFSLRLQKCTYLYTDACPKCAVPWKCRCRRLRYHGSGSP